jgi:hypothetical protein
MVTITNDAFFLLHTAQKVYGIGAQLLPCCIPGIGGCLAGQVTHQPGGSFQREEYGGLTGSPLSSPPEI